MNAIGEAIGELCKVILPINEEFYLGNSDSSIAICTLSSIDLLKNFANSEILNQISIVGRLLSENKGIDSIIKYVNRNPKVDTIIVCGKEVWGHKSGHSLFQLHKNGTDQSNRIINSTSPDPFLTVSKSEIKYFQDNVNLIDLINVTEFKLILKKSRFFNYPSSCLLRLISFFFLYSSKISSGVNFSSIDACTTKCQISINSSLASASLNSTGVFHHFQFVVLCSSTASCIMAVHKAETLPSESFGYLSKFIMSDNPFWSLNIVSNRSFSCDNDKII